MKKVHEKKLILVSSKYSKMNQYFLKRKKIDQILFFNSVVFTKNKIDNNSIHKDDIKKK